MILISSRYQDRGRCLRKFVVRSLCPIVIVWGALLSLFSLAASAAVAAAERLDKVRIQPQTKEHYLRVFSGAYDVIEFHSEEFVALVSATDRVDLQSRGIPYTVERENISKFYSERAAADLERMSRLGAVQSSPATMGGFETFSEMVAHIDQASSDHPTIMTAKFSIGLSVEGRNLWVIKISDNPNVDEDEPEILLTSLIHSREPAAGATTLHLMDYLTDNYGIIPEITDLVDTREIFILPVENPDGYVFNETSNPSGGGLWRKNRTDNGGGEFGVDLNRNHTGHWGYDDMGSSPDSSSSTYRGPAPFSEPETAAKDAFVRSRNFNFIHNHHCYGNLELWPISYDRHFSRDEDAFRIVGDSITADNGYAAVNGWDLYPTNGDADDYAFTDSSGGKSSIWSMTAEIGNSADGFWPLPSRIPTLVAENVNSNLYLIKIADNPRKIGPPYPPTLSSLADTSLVDSVTLQWGHDDPYNPAVSYEITELVGQNRVTDDAETVNGYWDRIRFSQSAARAHSGSFSWHEEGENRKGHWLNSTQPLFVREGDTLRFWMWYDIETDWDYFYMQIATDGGYEYNNLPHPSLTTNTNPNGTNVGNGITGSSGDWIEVEFDLSAFVGQTVHLRFTYFTDWGTRGEGVYIDDINLVEFYDSKSIVASGLTEFSGDFGSFADGDHYFTIQAEDAETQTSRPSNIVRVRVNAAAEYVCGDADGSGAVTIGDVTFLIARIFSGGVAPDPLEAGDADGGGTINIGDVTYLIARIFSGGPEPICPE